MGIFETTIADSADYDNNFPGQIHTRTRDILSDIN